MTNTVIISRGIAADPGWPALPYVSYDVVGYGREIVFDASVIEAKNPIWYDLADIERIVFPPQGFGPPLPAYANGNSLGALS